jgi:crossover junction endodeoxyribonuclease RuvC
MRIAAIDPGLSGAACVLEQINGAVMLISVIDLPVIGEGAKRRLDAMSFAGWLKHYAPTRAVIENARAMPKQGVSSMFRYGRLTGAVEGVVAAQGIPMTLAEATTWKRAMRLNANKENCRARAVQLLPDASNQLQRVRDHNRAESILLGLYGLERGLFA